MGEWHLEKHGGGGYWLILGSKSQSQAVGLGMGLFPDGINLWGCQEWPTSSHEHISIFPPQNPFPISVPCIDPLPLLGFIPGLLSISSSCLLKAFIAKIRGLALLIDDLPIIISFQSPIAIYSKFPNFALYFTSLSLGHQLSN